MKKLMMLAILSLWAYDSNAQVRLGANIGLPIGKSSKNVADFSFGVDVAYVFEVSDVFSAGFTGGYTHFIAEKYSYNMPYYYNYGYVSGVSYGPTIEGGGGFGVIPVAATAKVNLSDMFFFGADAGYAFSTEKNGKGSFYYQPKLGVEFGQIDLFLSYKGYYRDNLNLGTLNLGAYYNF